MKKFCGKEQVASGKWLKNWLAAALMVFGATAQGSFFFFWPSKRGKCKCNFNSKVVLKVDLKLCILGIILAKIEKKTL